MKKEHKKAGKAGRVDADAILPEYDFSHARPNKYASQVENMAEIIKAGYFTKIIGNFGENMVCNWLSRSGFEVALLDHTGIDVLAYRRATGERLGITVKSRTRLTGTENTCVNLLSSRRGRDDRQRVVEACEAFACTPWIAVYVEARDAADLYLTSLDNFDAKYRRLGSAIDTWSMASKCREQYEQDPAVKHICIKLDSKHWV